MAPSGNEENCSITGVQSYRWKEPGEACLNQTLQCSAGQTQSRRDKPVQSTVDRALEPSHGDETSAQFSTVQSLSRVRVFAIPWTTAHKASLSITNSQSLLKLKSIEVMMSSNHLNLCHPLLLLPSIFSSIRVFSNESILHIRWPKYWSFSLASVLPMNIQD